MKKITADEFMRFDDAQIGDFFFRPGWLVTCIYAKLTTNEVIQHASINGSREHPGIIPEETCVSQLVLNPANPNI